MTRSGGDGVGVHFVLKLSKLCNLRCTYCSEYDELGLRERMPLEGLEFFIRSVAEYADEYGDNGTEYRFVFHGGEPLLLPDSYFARIVALQNRLLTPYGVRYKNFVQSNLYKVSRSRLNTLKELNISLSISLDVFGNQRLTLAGMDSQDRVLDNLQMLCDIGYLENPGFGAISVLHRGNIDHVEETYEFFNRLGISYRVLPLEAGTADEPPGRFAGLTITNEEKVAALKRVARRHARSTGGINVLPLLDYLQSAVRFLSGSNTGEYVLPRREWALIVNTNGDSYNSGDEYSATGYMGNIFRQTLAEIFASPSYASTVRTRSARMKTCGNCPYRVACPRIPVAETPPSEREHDRNGLLLCAVARPLIDHYVAELRSLPEAMAKFENPA